MVCFNPKTHLSINQQLYVLIIFSIRRCAVFEANEGFFIHYILIQTEKARELLKILDRHDERGEEMGVVPAKFGGELARRDYESAISAVWECGETVEIVMGGDMVDTETVVVADVSTGFDCKKARKTRFGRL